MLLETPFRYEEPLAPDELVDREDELAALLARARGARNTRVTAPRRYGKTSLLRRLLRDADLEGIVGVYVDFYGVLTVADVAARIELAYERGLRGPLRTWLGGVLRTLRPVGRVSAGPAAVEARLGEGAPDPAGTALLERLALPLRVAERTGQTVLVVFDEFQALLGAGGTIDALFRSEIQHHGDRVAYVFAGSQVGMMRELFADRRRPFFDQAAPLALPPLPAPAIVEHLDHAFGTTGRSLGEALDPLLALADGHPQRAMQLAAHLWAHTARGEEADASAWAGALRTVGAEVDDDFRARWDALPASSQRALSAIAAGDPPFGRAGRERHGTTKGAARGGLDRLADLGEIEADPEAAPGYRIVDPLLRVWVAAGRRWPELPAER